MTGNELIDRINKTKLGDCEISINFSLNGNGSYVLPILNIIPECTDLNLFIDIGQIDKTIANDIKLINSNCNITPVSNSVCGYCGKPLPVIDAHMDCLIAEKERLMKQQTDC